MTQRMNGPTIFALIYHAGFDPGPILRGLVSELIAKGAKCAGFIQRDIEKPGRARCDMILENVSNGSVIPISEDRGPGARGCRLDEGELARAMMATVEALSAGPDILFINKFGKSEAEGRGFRPLIAKALEREIPILIAVPWNNIESWRRFAGDFSHEFAADRLPADLDDLRKHLGLTHPTSGCVEEAVPALLRSDTGESCPDV